MMKRKNLVLFVTCLIPLLNSCAIHVTITTLKTLNYYKMTTKQMKQPIRRVRTSANYDYTIDSHPEVCIGVSETEPNMGLELGEIINDWIRGMPIQGLRNNPYTISEEHTDDELFDDDEIIRTPDTDIIDVHEAREMVTEFEKRKKTPKTKKSDLPKEQPDLKPEEEVKIQ